MKNLYEYKLHKSFINIQNAEGKMDFSGSKIQKTITNKLRKDLHYYIKYDEGHGGDGEYEIVSHTITYLDNTIMLTILVRGKLP